MNCSHSSRGSSLLNSQPLSDNMVFEAPKMAIQFFIKVSNFFFFLNFTTAAPLSWVAWSTMCKIWTFSTTFTLTATTWLKPLGIDNPTTGLNVGFLYLRQVSHCSSMLLTFSISSFSCMSEDWNKFFTFSDLEWPNWQCSFFAIFFPHH